MTDTGHERRVHLFMRISALSIAVGQALDVSSTNTVLALGGSEMNPLMRISMAELGSLWWLPKAATGFVILACVFSGRMPPPTRRIISLTKIALAVSAVSIAINIANIAQLAAGRTGGTVHCPATLGRARSNLVAKFMLAKERQRSADDRRQPGGVLTRTKDVPVSGCEREWFTDAAPREWVLSLV